MHYVTLHTVVLGKGRKSNQHVCMNMSTIIAWTATCFSSSLHRLLGPFLMLRPAANIGPVTVASQHPWKYDSASDACREEQDAVLSINYTSILCLGFLGVEKNKMPPRKFTCHATRQRDVRMCFQQPSRRHCLWPCTAREAIV